MGNSWKFQYAFRSPCFDSFFGQWMVVSDMIPTHPISQASKDPDLASHLLLQALDVLRIISGTWVKDS